MLYNIIYSLPHPLSLREMPGGDGYNNEEPHHHLPGDEGGMLRRLRAKPRERLHRLQPLLRQARLREGLRLLPHPVQSGIR